MFLGSWLSGYFIVATDAWMQHPVGLHAHGRTAPLSCTSFWALLLNPWALWQYAHNMSGAVVTGAFVMAAVGAFYLLSSQHEEHGRLFVKVGVIAGLIVERSAVVPHRRPAGQDDGPASAGDAGRHGSPVRDRRTARRWSSSASPTSTSRSSTIRLRVPKMLSFLTYRRWNAEVKGLNAFPQQDWPHNIPLLYYSYHIMVGLGTIFIAVACWRRSCCGAATLFRTRAVLWVLMLSFRFPTSPTPPAG